MDERKCEVCGLKVSVCRNKLNFTPRGGGANESRWKRAPGLEDHILNTRRANKGTGLRVPT